MIKLGVFEWVMIALEIFLVVSLAWSIRYAKRIGYPSIKKDIVVPATLATVYTIVLFLYLFGIWT